MKRDLTKILFDETYSSPPKNSYEINETSIKCFDDRWLSDLLDMNDYKPLNSSGYGFILVVK